MLLYKKLKLQQAKTGYVDFLVKPQQQTQNHRVCFDIDK